MHTRTWHVAVHISESDGSTYADAVLTTDGGTELRHHGTARKNPSDRDVPEIGDELATSRALSGLAHDLLDAAVGDVEENVAAAR